MTFHWPENLALSSERYRKVLRQSVLEGITAAKSGHPGGSLSMIEFLSVIMDGYFEQNPKTPEDPDRDRLVLSKGHGVPTLYSLMSALGYFEAAELVKLRSLGHFLQGHPDRDKYKLMEASTGSLGQGASVALGLALGLRHQFQTKQLRRLPRVYCVLGDGEIQEGQVWECLMAAGKFKPGNLVFVLDRNRGQIDGPVEEIMNLDPLDEKLRSFGMNVSSVDGHDTLALKGLFSAIEIKPESRPYFVIANTVKGKGVSFMEHPTKWHGAAPKKEELERALDELWGAGERPYGTLLA
jgi:transketolase